MAKQEVMLTKQQAADSLELSVRRVLELSSQGKLKRHKFFDPTTQRDSIVFAASDVERFKKESNLEPAAAPGPLLLPAPEEPAAEPERIRPWVNLDVAADLTGLSQRLLVRLIREGKLPALDEHTAGWSRYRIHRKDLDAIAGERVTFDPEAHFSTAK